MHYELSLSESLSLSLSHSQYEDIDIMLIDSHPGLKAGLPFVPSASFTCHFSNDLIESNDLIDLIGKLQQARVDIDDTVVVNGVVLTPSLLIAVTPFVKSGSAQWEEGLIVNIVEDDYNPFTDIPF